jgi:hypothetical protein
VSRIDLFLTRMAELRATVDPAAVEQTAETSEKIDVMMCGVMLEPELNVVRCFMVNFVGSDSVDVNVLDDPMTAIDRAGSVVASIKKFIAETEFGELSDVGCGGIGWHLGVLCTPGEAWLLYRMAYQRFESAISADLLQIHITPYSVWPKDAGK